MESSPEKVMIRGILDDLHKDEGYRDTLKSAMESAAEHVPLFTNVAISVNTHLGGSLGTRSTRKQLQAFMHHAAGNMNMRINSSSSVPSTYFLPVCAKVGRGKSIYHTFMKNLMKMLTRGTTELDRQLFMEKENNSEPDEQAVASGKTTKKFFVPRQLLTSPGSKEGWE